MVFIFISCVTCNAFVCINAMGYFSCANKNVSGYFDNVNSFRVSAKIILVIVMLFFALSSGIAQKKKNSTFRDTCKNLRDTTFLLNFSLDTTKSDFYDLLSLIESKGEFSRLSSENKVDSSTDNHIILKKILCWEKFSDSPVELWRLNNIFSISYFLVSTIPTKEKDEPLPSFRVTQLNFIDNKQMEVAANKILEIHWGEPLLAWNFWFLIKGNRRVYILQTYLPGFIEVTKSYMDIIQEEWVNKNIR